MWIRMLHQKFLQLILASSAKRRSPGTNQLKKNRNGRMTRHCTVVKVWLEKVSWYPINPCALWQHQFSGQWTEKDMERHDSYNSNTICIIRPVGARDAGDAAATMVPPYFDRSVNPFSTRGTDYADHISTTPTGFSSLPTALNSLTHWAEKDT